MNGRKAFTLALDILCVLIVLRLLVPADTPLAAAGWRTAMLTCQTLAENFGRAAITCEAHYWRTIKS